MSDSVEGLACGTFHVGGGAFEVRARPSDWWGRRLASGPVRGSGEKEGRHPGCDLGWEVAVLVEGASAQERPPISLTG